MPDVKQYGLKGVGTDVQFGKSSGRLKYSTDHFEARDATDSAFVRIGGLDPVNDTDLATKKYVDLAAAGISYKDAVRVATNSLITGLDDGISGTPTDDMSSMTYNVNGNYWSLYPYKIDNVTLANGDRVLVKDGDSKGGGIFVFNQGQSRLERATDSDNNTVLDELRGGVLVYVQEGRVWADTSWIVSSPKGIVNLGTDNITWTLYNKATGLSASDGLKKDGNFIKVRTDNTTIGIIGDDVTVKSSATQYQVLTSAGNTSNAATWGAVQLDSSDATTGILPTSRGGLGEDFGNYANQSIIVKGTNGGLAKGNQYEVLQVGASNLEYDKVDLANSTTGTLSITRGGTGATNAADARTNLGVQLADAQLTDIAGLTPDDGKFIVGDGNNFITESGDTARISLGVGTTDSPSIAGLTVTGTSASFNGLTYTMPSVAGTNGQFLKNDGAGGLTWGDETQGSLGTLEILTNNNSAVKAKWIVLHCNTTDATPSPLYLDGSATEISVASDTTMSFEAKVVGRNKTANESFVFILKGMAVNNSGTVTIFNQGTDIVSETDEDWDAIAEANSTNLRIKVTGEAGKDIMWVAQVNTVEVTY
tara:strand:- start:387 stop:2162 length:1776 start_codon:yes stop_codon:yes gene_type:complete